MQGRLKRLPFFVEQQRVVLEEGFEPSIAFNACKVLGMNALRTATSARKHA